MFFGVKLYDIYYAFRKLYEIVCLGAFLRSCMESKRARAWETLEERKAAAAVAAAAAAAASAAAAAAAAAHAAAAPAASTAATAAASAGAAVAAAAAPKAAGLPLINACYVNSIRPSLATD